MLNVTRHAIERLQQRYRISNNNPLKEKLNKASSYKVLDVNAEGLETRCVIQKKKSIQYLVKGNDVITFIPPSRKQTYIGTLITELRRDNQKLKNEVKMLKNEIYTLKRSKYER